MVEVEVTRVDPEEKMKAEIDFSFKFIRANAGELVMEELRKFRKKIPQRGLDNRARGGWGFRHSLRSKGYTIYSRMDKLRWSIPFLPPQMVAMAMTSPEFDRKKAKALLSDILQLLVDLRRNLKTVTVIDPPKWWGEMITTKENSIRSTATMFGLLLEAEYEVLEAKT